MSPLSHYQSSHGTVCSRRQRKTASGLVIVCVIGFQKIFDQLGTMVTLVHLINNWQMHPTRKRTLLAALLLSACIFAVTAAHADEQQAKAVTAAKPGTVFRDCPNCPEMVVIPAGSFNMGSPESEKVWATKHGASPESVSDEAPQHRVTLRSFAIGKYDVTQGEYAAFVRETRYSPGDGCFISSMPKANRRADARWQSPGFNQTERDPVVCVSWQDARAYISWLNGKMRGRGSNPSDDPYHLPSEAEWEYAAPGGATTTPVQLAMPGTKTFPMATLIRWDRNLRIHSAFTISWAMSGNGQRIVTLRPTLKRR